MSEPIVERSVRLTMGALGELRIAFVESYLLPGGRNWKDRTQHSVRISSVDMDETLVDWAREWIRTGKVPEGALVVR